MSAEPLGTGIGFDNTGGPLYKGHIGTSKFVHCREVVHSSEVENVLAL